MLERLLHRDALARVKLKHLLHQIDRLGAGFREDAPELRPLRTPDTETLSGDSSGQKDGVEVKG